MPDLLKDSSNKNFIPQYLREDGSSFEALKGKDGASFVQLSGSNVTLLNAVMATGAGTSQPVGSFKTYVFEVWGTATTLDIQIQAVGPSGTPRNLKVWDELNNAYLTGDIITKGIYSVSAPSFTNLRANVVSVSGGNVSLAGGMMQ